MTEIRWMRWLVLAVVMLALVPMGNSAAQAEPIPYLMYFDLNNGSPQWVIENADATDSRPFGVGLMAADTDTVDGPGWSASGEWFAWTSENVEKWGPNLAQGHVLNVDGSRQVTLPDDIVDVNLYWLPNTDVLVAVAWREAGGRAAMIERMATGEFAQGYYTAPVDVLFIDAATDTILQTHSFPVTIPTPEFGLFMWPNDFLTQGDQVLLSLTSEHADFNSTTTRSLFDASGALLRQIVIETSDPTTEYPISVPFGFDDWFSSAGLEAY